MSKPLGAALALTFVVAAIAAPSITTVQNNYGLVSPGLPGYGIAPGSLFLIGGSGLANTTTPLQSSAAPGLQTSLNGVSVSATVGGTTKLCFLYYLSPTQIDAVLPGSMPLGNGTMTVTNNGQTSAAFAIIVVQSAFGILGYNGQLAAAYDGAGNLYTITRSANPSQPIVLWGSGVGGDPNNDDKTFPQNQNNLTTIPIQAWVGGLQATILYRGRSQYPGVDQIVLTIPAGVTAGCYVSIVIQSGNVVTNTVLLPVAANGAVCSDSNLPFGGVQVQALGGKDSANIGQLQVWQVVDIKSTGTQTTNEAYAIFHNIQGFTAFAGAFGASLGSCYVSLPSSGSGPSPYTITGLDAGSTVNVTGPAGSIAMTTASFGAGFYTASSIPAGFIPAAGGVFNYNNGAGGKGIGAFTAALNYAVPVTWTNRAAITTVNRAQGLTLTWTGGTAGSYVQIDGYSSTLYAGQPVGAGFSCYTPAAAGQFTVPAWALLALPAGNGGLSLWSYTNPQPFTAPGMDAGYQSTGVTIDIYPSYQ